MHYFPHLIQRQNSLLSFSALLSKQITPQSVFLKELWMKSLGFHTGSNTLQDPITCHYNHTTRRQIGVYKARGGGFCSNRHPRLSCKESGSLVNLLLQVTLLCVTKAVSVISASTDFITQEEERTGRWSVELILFLGFKMNYYDWSRSCSKGWSIFLK